MPSNAQMAYRHDLYYLALQLLQLGLEKAAQIDLKRDGWCLDSSAKRSLFPTSR